MLEWILLVCINCVPTCVGSSKKLLNPMEVCGEVVSKSGHGDKSHFYRVCEKASEAFTF